MRVLVSFIVLLALASVCAQAQEVDNTLPADLSEFLTPDYKGAAKNLLSVVVPAGLSEYGIALFKRTELKKRLDNMEVEIANLEKIKKSAESGIEKAFNDMIDAHDAYKKAYEAHEKAIRGSNLDDQKTDSATLAVLNHRALQLSQAEQKHFRLTSEWEVGMAMNGDMLMGLQRNKWRLQRALSFLDRQLPTIHSQSH